MKKAKKTKTLTLAELHREKKIPHSKMIKKGKSR